MKNKFIQIIKIFFIFLLISNSALSNEFIFETKEINVYENGNIIKASDGVAKSTKNNFSITGKEFEFNNKNSTLTVLKGIALFPDQNIKILANKFDYNENDALLRAYGNVIIKNSLNNIVIKSQNIIFNIKKDTVVSNKKTTIDDKLGNYFSSKGLLYKINDKLIKIENASLIDFQNNKYQIAKAFIDLKSNKLIGKDISIDFNNTAFQVENEPRVKGNSIIYNKNNTVVNKGIFTTCKKTDKCPPWQFLAEEIKHDKEKKIINYKNAWLKIYDKPVFYFPKFFHPDPTVKRQSGFLMPSFGDSTNNGSSLNIPYYLVVAENQDFTFNPRFYSNDKVLLQTEFRGVGNKSEHILDFSSMQQRKKDGKEHFFSQSKKLINLPNFEESEIVLEVQQTSSDTYLKSHKLKSPLIDNYNLLESSLNVSAYREDFAFDVGFLAYENLSKKKSDRYEFVYPSYNAIKQLDNLVTTDGNLYLESSGFIKNYDTNVYETVAVNNLTFNSNPKHTNQGFKNSFDLLLKNINTESQKSKNYDDKKSARFSSIIQNNLSYPLKKLSGQNTDVLEPKITMKYSPNNNKDLSDTDRRIDINNIFSLNRLGLNETLEGGTSFTYGLDYSRVNQDDRQVLGARIANIVRLKEDKDLPRNSSLGQKTSNIVGDLKFDLSKNFNIKYDFSIDENLKDTNYQLVETEISVNNFITKFEYLNQNNTGNNETYLTNKTSYIVNNSKRFIFETRENKKTKITEFYNLIYEYKNDCLVAAIEYNKDYYTDRDLKPEENIFLKLTIVPFGKTSSPNLMK